MPARTSSTARPSSRPRRLPRRSKGRAKPWTLFYLSMTSAQQNPAGSGRWRSSSHHCKLIRPMHRSRIGRGEGSCCCPAKASITGNACRPTPQRQRSLHSRSDQGNHLSSMTAVDMKITVGSKEQWRIVDFRQPNQCSISEGWGNIVVPLKQGTDRANLLLQHERELNNSSFDESQSQ